MNQLQDDTAYQHYNARSEQDWKIPRMSQLQEDTAYQHYNTRTEKYLKCLYMNQFVKELNHKVLMISNNAEQ